MDYIDPIIIISIFGAACVSFLWLRDTRIFYRTGYEGYKKAMYRGVLYTALAWLGAALCGLRETGTYTMMYIGIGCVLLALYLHSRVKKEDVWKGNESGWTRFSGQAPIRKERK
ncbi:MAG: ABC transporter permease [Methanocorpusculum sp.]|nr:ABC transporter permease [Methanocorpusculum sp.]